MMTISIALLALGCLTAVFQWQAGMIICVIVALLQDPARKLIPGQPVVFVVFVGVVFAAAWLGAWLNRVRLGPSVIHGWKKTLSAPAMLFVALLAAQAIHSVVRWGNPVLPAIGAIFYIAPILAIVFAHQCAVRFGTAGIRRFLWVYVLVSLPWMLGIVAEANGVSWGALGEVGKGQMIYSFGLNQKAMSGFYRAAEVAAWHIGMVSCCLFILLNGRKLSVFKSAAVAVAVLFLLYVGFVTGRRKMLVYVMVFGAVYLSLFAWFLRGKARLAIFGIAACVIGYAMLLGIGPDPGESGFDKQDFTLARRDVGAAWQARAMTVFADIPDRFNMMAYWPVEWAVREFGWLGAGLGAGAQGAQYFGGGMAKFGGAGEGGLGKITLDLGLPGIPIFLWILYSFAKQIWVRLEVLSRTSRQHATMAFGFAGLIAANVATFAVATQVFGDVFVLLMLGWSVGFLLAMPAVAYAETQARGRVGPPQPLGFRQPTGTVTRPDSMTQPQASASVVSP